MSTKILPLAACALVSAIILGGCGAPPSDNVAAPPSPVTHQTSGRGGAASQASTAAGKFTRVPVNPAATLDKDFRTFRGPETAKVVLAEYSDFL